MVTETFHAGTTDPVSIDCHAAPCELCHGAGAVYEEHEPGEGPSFYPAWGYEPGQCPCPACQGDGR